MMSDSKQTALSPEVQEPTSAEIIARLTAENIQLREALIRTRATFGYLPGVDPALLSDDVASIGASPALSFSPSASENEKLHKAWSDGYDQGWDDALE